MRHTVPVDPGHVRIRDQRNGREITNWKSHIARTVKNSRLRGIFAQPVSL